MLKFDVISLIGHGSLSWISQTESIMIQNKAKYSIVGWCGIAGGVESRDDWARWAKGNLNMQTLLPRPQLEIVPSRFSRRLSSIGRCLMYVSEQCMHILQAQPAVISASRHGDLPLLDRLIQNIRDQDDISPTNFAYSVHNRYSSLISIFAGYRGVNGAYSSVRDGFPLSVCEAASLIMRNPKLQVLLVAYEPEIPTAYTGSISDSWSPHAVAFVLQAPTQDLPVYSLSRHESVEQGAPSGGNCLPQLMAMLNKRNQRDQLWEYQVSE